MLICVVCLASEFPQNQNDNNNTEGGDNINDEISLGNISPVQIFVYVVVTSDCKMLSAHCCSTLLVCHNQCGVNCVPPALGPTDHWQT